jgi:hypothetical protein
LIGFQSARCFIKVIVLIGGIEDNNSHHENDHPDAPPDNGSISS